MTRRWPVVLAAVLVACAGCASSPSSSSEGIGMIAMRPADDAGFVGDFSRELPEPYPHDLTDVLGVRGALRNRSTTVVGREPALVDDPYVVDGTYHEVSATKLRERRGYEVELWLTFDASDVEGETVQFGDLSAVDRDRLRPVLALNRSVNGGLDRDEYHLAYTLDEGDRSFFVGESRTGAIAYRGSVVSFRVGHPERTTRGVYRYEATVVANSTAAYADRVAQRYAVNLTGLSDGERAVVQAALNGSYVPTSTDDPAFASILDEVRGHAPVQRLGARDEWLVRYEGDLYRAQIEYYEFVADGVTVVGGT